MGGTAVDSCSNSPYIADFLHKSLQLAISLNTEKARSKLIICSLLLAVKEALNNQISLFSGEEFNVEAETGLTGKCGFIISCSKEQLFVKAPVTMLLTTNSEPTYNCTIIHKICILKYQFG